MDLLIIVLTYFLYEKWEITCYCVTNKFKCVTHMHK